MTEYALENDFRLGRLLVDLDLVTRTRVEQAAVLSSLTTLPLGKLLSMLDYVPERLIKSTIEAQSLLRDRLIKLDLAKKAMSRIWCASTVYSRITAWCIAPNSSENSSRFVWIKASA